MLNCTNLRAALALGALATLAACGGGSSSASNRTADAPAAQSPTERLAEINKAYAENAIEARRTWGGKRLTLGGEFDSAGRNPDGTTSVLLNPGGSVPSLGEFNVGRKNDDFVAGLKKGQTVAMTCTVDPKHEGFATEFVDCVPAKSGQ